MLVGDVGFISARAGLYRIHSESITFNYPEAMDKLILKELEMIKEYIIEEKIYLLFTIHSYIQESNF